MACEAQHCGRRPHLYDDLGVVNLAAGLVAAPPLEIWPTLVRRGPLPADVEAWISTVSHAVQLGMQPTAAHATMCAAAADASR
jgi:hypothetical protein